MNYDAKKLIKIKDATKVRPYYIPTYNRHMYNGFYIRRKIQDTDDYVVTHRGVDNFDVERRIYDVYGNPVIDFEVYDKIFIALNNIGELSLSYNGNIYCGDIYQGKRYYFEMQKFTKKENMYMLIEMMIKYLIYHHSLPHQCQTIDVFYVSCVSYFFWKILLVSIQALS